MTQSKSSTATMGRRTVAPTPTRRVTPPGGFLATPQTITPLQQLFTLNGPFINQQANSLAENLMKQKDTNARIHTAYQKLFQRAPRETELKIAGRFLRGKQNDTTAWAQYAHALLAGNEFQFID